jgi:hypothetical protein
MPSHSLSTGWIETSAGRRALKKRSALARDIFFDTDLAGQFLEDTRTPNDPPAIRRRDRSARAVLEEIKIFALASQAGLPVPLAVWPRARAVLERFLKLDTLSHQGRFAVPPWQADLSTGDLGVGLALLAALDSPLVALRPALANFLRAKCWDPVAADWLDQDTRRHSLDSMGHNWWAVIVGGAGTVAALLGWKSEARRAAALLTQWFRYPGNKLMRKHRNFGPEGDFLEGFSYCDYALIHPMALARLLGKNQTLSEWLDKSQWQGLAEWYRHAFLTTHAGAWPVRFGDVGISYCPRPSVWHPLAEYTGDAELHHLARQVSPEPTLALDFLFWREKISAPARRKPAEGRRVFPTSGCAFLGGPHLSVSVRAGEFWNHNHLDAGSFVFAQNKRVWIDDAGTGPYSSPDYITHYAAPASHNIAYVPDLVPTVAESKELGLDLKGEFLAHHRVPGCEFLQVDTRVLSGGSLLRSRRSFFVLDEDILLIWDDLEARSAEKFQIQLHTAEQVRRRSVGRILLASHDRAHCTILGFSDGPTTLAAAPAKMGELPEKGKGPSRSGTVPGTVLRWRARRPALRQKFLCAMGESLSRGNWRERESGWECRMVTPTIRWTAWFNRLADGRIAHQNTTSSWQGFVTDAYALVLRENAGHQTLFACSASFVRRGPETLHGTLQRETLIRVFESRVTPAR